MLLIAHKQLIAVVALAFALALWCGASAVSGDTPAAGNDFYRVFVEDEPGGHGTGSYTVATGPSHPAGEGRNILFSGGAGDAWSSYTTVRSYTTGTDYVQTLDGPSSGNIVVSLDDYSTVQAMDTTGYRTTYDLPGPNATPDALRIVSDVNVNGTTFADSAVEITTTVTNVDNVPLSIGIRYLLDFQVAGDDGSTFAEVNPSQAPRTIEITYAFPAFAAFRIEDNTGSDPTFAIFATVSADFPARTPATSAPDALQYAYWPDAYGAAFDHHTAGRDIADPSGLNDSAVLYYFGATEATAIDLDPQQSVTISISLFATPAPTPTFTPTSTPIPTPTPTATPPVALPAALPATGAGLAADSQRRSGAWEVLAALSSLVLVAGGLAAHRLRRRNLQRRMH